MPREFKTVLCPTDFSEASGRAIEYGARFVRLSEGLLLIAHVIHIPTEQYRDEAGEVLGFDVLKRRAEAQLSQACDRYAGGYHRTQLLLDIGDPFTQLMAIASDQRVDLIVTATHGRSGIGHLIMGSVAEKIIRHAPCPVLVVRNGAE
jgi:universal stress protein A